MRPVGLVCVWVAVRLNFFVACYKRSEYFSRGQGALRKASVFQADLNIGLDWIYKRVSCLHSSKDCLLADLNICASCEYRGQEESESELHLIIHNLLVGTGVNSIS